MNKNNNLNNDFTTRKSVDGMVGVPRTQGVGGMINSNSSQHAPHGKILNKKTIHINPSNDLGRRRADARLNNKINPAIDAKRRVSAQDVINRGAKRDLDDSLNAIDLQEQKQNKKDNPKRKAKRRKIIKYVSIIVGVLIVLVIGFIVIKAILAGNKSFQAF